VLCGHLRLDNELGGEECLCLVLRGVGAVDDVRDELGAEGQVDVVAVDVALLGLIDEVEIVALLADGDVYVFAALDVAFGAEDEETAVAPGAECVGGEPVEADVAEAHVAAQDHVAEILEERVLRLPG
jgi:hypothetical protein